MQLNGCMKMVENNGRISGHVRDSNQNLRCAKKNQTLRKVLVENLAVSHTVDRAIDGRYVM